MSVCRYCIYVFLLFMFFIICQMEKIKYISLERPVLLNYNKKYIPFYNVSARRYSRHDPKYYISGHAKTLIPLGNNVFFNSYFYKSWGNTYKPTFFELHYRLCDLFSKDTFLGSFFKRGSFSGSCPFPAGEFHVENCSIRVEDVPAALPFKKGRIYMNATYKTGESLAHGYLDIEVKEKQIG